MSSWASKEGLNVFVFVFVGERGLPRERERERVDLGCIITLVR